MKFKEYLNFKYQIISINTEQKTDDYFTENKDDRDFLLDISHSKNHFLKNKKAKNIARLLDVDITWLYTYIRKQV